MKITFGGGFAACMPHSVTAQLMLTHLATTVSFVFAAGVADFHVAFSTTTHAAYAGQLVCLFTACLSGFTVVEC